MEMGKPINFGDLTKGQVHNLSGHDRGLAARESFKLDQLDLDGIRHVVYVPDDIYGVSPSFIQGLFSGSLKKLGNDIEEFRKHYEIEATDLVRRQIERGLTNIVLDRTSPLC
jgi:hypothetical protein